MSSYQQRDNILRSCTVRIATDTKGGTGFFVAPGLILTCAHVVESEAGRPTNLPVEVFWENQKFLAQITEFLPNPYPDLALLRIDFSEHSCVYLYDKVTIGDQIYSYGYPRNYARGDSALFVYEGPTDNLKPQLKLKDAQSCPGLSGAPLLNLSTGGVCGIVKSSRDIATDLGGRAIPTTTIYSVFNDLVFMQQQFHEKDRTWSQFIIDPDEDHRRMVEHRAITKLGLEALGYMVRENIVLSGIEIDLLAEKSEAFFTHKMIIKWVVVVSRMV